MIVKTFDGEESFYVYIGAYIFNFRKTRQTTKRSCKIAQCSPDNRVGVEKGKREPSGAYYAKIAEYLGVSLDYLVAGREPPSVPVQQIIGDRNTNNTVMFTGGGAVNLSEYERELLKLCAAFDMRQKNALLSYAYGLEKQTKRED